MNTKVINRISKYMSDIVKKNIGDFVVVNYETLKYNNKIPKKYMYNLKILEKKNEIIKLVNDNNGLNITDLNFRFTYSLNSYIIYSISFTLYRVVRLPFIVR